MSLRLALIVLASGCTCAGTSAPAPPGPTLGPIEHPRVLRGSALRLAAIDEHRALLVSRDDVDHPSRLAVTLDGAPRWERNLPCDADHIGRLGVTAGAERVSLACIALGALWTFALRTGDGELVWSHSRGASPSELDGLRSLAIGGVLVEHAHPHGVVALDAASGRELWSRRTDAYRVLAAGDRLALDTLIDVELVDPRTGRTERTVREVLGVIPNGLCSLGEGGVERVGLDGTRERLIGPAALERLGVTPREPGLVTRCGRRDGATVLFIDRDAETWVVVAREGEVVHALRLPPTSGAPGVAGWDRPLPRFVPLVDHDDEVHVLDLDRGVEHVSYLMRTDESFRAYGEILAVRARIEDRFVLSFDDHVIEIDGASGALSADDARAEGAWWADLEDAVYGGTLLVPREEEERLVVEPARPTSDGALARRFASTSEARREPSSGSGGAAPGSSAASTASAPSEVPSSP